MPTPAELAERKAILDQLRTSFNAFAGAYNTAFSAVSALGLPEYSALITALKLMAGEVNKASPAVTAAIQEIDMLIRPPPINRPTVPPQPPAEGFTPSANGFTVPDDGAELTDNSGQVWSLSGNQVLVNGENFNWGWGNKIKFWYGIVYHRSPPPGPANWLDWFENTWRNNGTTEPGTEGEEETVPDAPSVCTATMASHARINVTWQDNSDNEVGFKLERQLSVGGTWAQIATPAMNAESFASTGLVAETGYDYRVLAYNQAGDSVYSNVASATTDEAPAPGSMLPLKESATTGAINAGEYTLIVASSTGFAVNDYITVELGQEPGGGMRGTKGVGGVWPALSYADGATMTADTTQPPGTYAWREDVGEVLRWNSEFGANQWVSNYGYNGKYYFVKAIPRALEAKILAINGTTWTLDTPAKVSVAGANVYFNNMPILNEAMAFTGGAAEENVVIEAPAGDYAISGAVQIGGKTGWTFKGQGVASTRFFSPKGCPCLRFQIIYSPNTTVEAFAWEGNMGDNQFGVSFYTPGYVFHETMWPMMVKENDVPRGAQGYCWPQAITFAFSPNGVEQDIKVIDTFMHACDAFASNNTWAYRVENIQNEQHREYVNWQFHWGDSLGGGAVDCSVWCPKLCAAFEGFKQNGWTFLRCTGTNAIMSSNVGGNFVFKDCVLNFTDNCQGDASSWPPNTVICNINSNIAQGQGYEYLDDGGLIENMVITQTGHMNGNNDTFQGIVINSNNPNVQVIGGSYTAPDYVPGSTTNGPFAINATGANTLVNGFTVNGTPSYIVLNNGNGWPNIFLQSGTAINCNAELIWAWG